MGNTLKKFIFLLDSISQASWITSIPKEQLQGFPKCLQLTHTQRAILHYPGEDSAQTAQTGTPKPQSRHTEQLLSLGRAGPREMSSLQETLSPTARGCPELEPSVLPCTSSGQWQGQPQTPTLLAGHTVFPTAQGHFSTGCILSN